MISVSGYVKSSTPEPSSSTEPRLTNCLLSSLFPPSHLPPASQIVAYRDHPGQDNSYVTKTLPFTSETSELHSFLDNLRAGGGGDGPEAVIAGMAVALGDLQWRRNAAKMIVIITDAPPHGIGERGDGFPQGEPGGWDGLVLARNMAARGISCVGGLVFLSDCFHRLNASFSFHSLSWLANPTFPLMT